MCELLTFHCARQIAQASRAKGEMELSDRIAQVRKQIQKQRYRVDEFNDYGEVDMMQQYVKDAMQVQRRVMELRDAIDWIHKVGF